MGLPMGTHPSALRAFGHAAGWFQRRAARGNVLASRYVPRLRVQRAGGGGVVTVLDLPAATPDPLDPDQARDRARHHLSQAERLLRRMDQRQVPGANVHATLALAYSIAAGSSSGVGATNGAGGPNHTTEDEEDAETPRMPRRGDELRGTPADAWDAVTSDGPLHQRASTDGITGGDLVQAGVAKNYDVAYHALYRLSDKGLMTRIPRRGQKALFVLITKEGKDQ